MYLSRNLKISKFLSEFFQFLEVKFSIYLNRGIFVMGLTSSSASRYLKVQVTRMCGLRYLYFEIKGVEVKEYIENYSNMFFILFDLSSTSVISV